MCMNVYFGFKHTLAHYICNENFHGQTQVAHEFTKIRYVNIEIKYILYTPCSEGILISKHQGVNIC